MTQERDRETRRALAHRQHERMTPGGNLGGHRPCGRAVGAREDESGRLVGLDVACVRTQGHDGECEGEVA